MYRHGIVLIPDLPTLKKVISTSETIKGNKLSFDLNVALPHVTVLQSYFNPGFDAKEIVKEARKDKAFIIEPRTNISALSLKSTHHLDRQLWWTLHNTLWLSAFNKSLVNQVEHLLAKPSEKIVFENSQEQESYERTGYSGNLDAYEPHITVGVEGEERLKLPSSPQPAPINFRRLAFVEHGPLGEIRKILAEEQLPISWD